MTGSSWLAVRHRPAQLRPQLEKARRSVMAFHNLFVRGDKTNAFFGVSRLSSIVTLAEVGWPETGLASVLSPHSGVRQPLV